MAQLTYDGRKTGPADGAINNRQTQKILKESTETLKQSLRPDWISLFLLWYHTENKTVTNALNNPTSRDSFMNFMGCDFYKLYQQNDVLWPQQQQAIVNHANKASANPVKRFRLLLRAPLGAYNHNTQAFDFAPISNNGFNVLYPDKMAYGTESNCENMTVIPSRPWPNLFQVVFTNPDFIQTLPVPPEKAAVLLQERRNDKGEIDRNIYMDIEMDIDGFTPTPIPKNDTQTLVQPWIAHVHALRAVAYENERRNIVVGQWGFAKSMVQPTAIPAKPVTPAPLSVDALPAAGTNH